MTKETAMQQPDQVFVETVALYKALQSFPLEPETASFRAQVLSRLSANCEKLARSFSEEKEQLFCLIKKRSPSS